MSDKNQLKVAVIGCGKIADHHVEQIRRTSRCRIVAACDQEPLMARQLCERFAIERYFGEPREMLAACKPDLVHITTPPQSHLELGRLCLSGGCHIYVEKPFALNAEGTEELLGLAERTGLKATVGHDMQFSPVARRMRRLVNKGYLGGQPVHMESYYGYDLSNARYARMLLSDRQHWVRQLPGKLLHNVISHGIARIAEFMTTDSPQVIAHGFVSPMLRGLGEEEIIDELRVIITEANRTTVYFTFSSQMRPLLNEFRIYGPKNGLELDQDHQTLIKCSGTRHKSFAEAFIPPITTAGQQLVNTRKNLRQFLANDFHMKGGMRCLLEAFNASILDGAPLPIPYREILLTSRIMDAIFEQIQARKPA